jgi:hypothetical protein
VIYFILYVQVNNAEKLELQYRRVNNLCNRDWLKKNVFNKSDLLLPEEKSRYPDIAPGDNSF